MTDLGQFLGALIADVTRARVQADLEAVRVAELYRAVPLLEGAPLPRFRLPTISIEVPVVIEQVDSRSGAAPDQTFSPPDKKSLVGLVDTALERAGIDLPGSARDRLHSDLAPLARTRWRDQAGLAAALRATADLSSDVTHRLSELAAPGAAEEQPGVRATAVAAFQRELRAELQQRLVGQIGSQPRVVIGAATGQVRELQEPSLVTRMSITLQEDAFDLVTVDWGDGAPRERLLPE